MYSHVFVCQYALTERSLMTRASSLGTFWTLPVPRCVLIAWINHDNAARFWYWHTFAITQYLFHTDCDNFFKGVVGVVHCQKISGVRLSVQNIHHYTAGYMHFVYMVRITFPLKYLPPKLHRSQNVSKHTITNTCYIWNTCVWNNSIQWSYILCNIHIALSNVHGIVQQWETP